MVIKYELTLDDYIAFNLFHTSNSGALRRRRIVGTVLTSFITFVGTLLIGHPPELGIGFSVIIALFCVVISWYVYKLAYGRAQSRTVRRMYQEGCNKSILGPREVTIDENSIFSRSEFIEARYFWKGVDRIIETPDHAFLYVAAVSALIIPKREIASGDPLQFIEQAVEYWLAANPEKVVDTPPG